MRLRPHADGIVCTALAADEDVVDEDQVRPLRDAAAGAITRRGQHDQDFTWQAVLGPHPNTPKWLRFGPLGDQKMLGPVQLAPGARGQRPAAIAAAPPGASGPLIGWPSPREHNKVDGIH